MAVLRVGVLAGPRSAEAARLLRRQDQAGLLDVVLAERPTSVGLIIDAGGAEQAAEVADVRLDRAAPLAGQVSQLWAGRLAPFASCLAGTVPFRTGAAVLHEHDPLFPAAARRLLGRLRTDLRRAGLDDGRWTYDHIGSTAVAGLRAKRFLDLQIGAEPVPPEGSATDGVLAAAGFRPGTGSRPDSPGVDRDQIKDPSLAPAAAYRKRLYVRPDPGLTAILHVRLLGSPWWAGTVAFRDWLRADPSGRRIYEAAKEQAARAHAADADFDDYTRAKAAFFDQVSPWTWRRPAPRG